MKVLVAHPGTQYSYHLVQELERHGFLHQFWTCFAIPSNSFSGKLVSFLPRAIRKKISNRMIEGVPARKILTNVSLELSALWRLRRGGDREQILFLRNRKFQERIPDNAILDSDVVVGFDTSSWILAQRCKTLNRKFLLDVSIPHPRTKERVYRAIMRDYPEWKFALQKKEQQLVKLEEKEMELASEIVVASTFSKNSLVENGIPANKISVIPYGVDSNAFYPLSERKPGPIHFVFVGLVDARKGVPLLLNAWQGADRDDASLTLIGPIANEVRHKIYHADPSIQVKGRVSLEELKKMLPTFDVMIFPSYFEGFGLVILEAMASGLTVITTEATCAPDVIEPNKDGIIFQSGSSEALKEQIQHLLVNKERMKEYSRTARSKAVQYSWTAYGDRWITILKKS